MCLSASIPLQQLRLILQPLTSPISILQSDQMAYYISGSYISCVNQSVRDHPAAVGMIDSIPLIHRRSETSTTKSWWVSGERRKWRCRMMTWRTPRKARIRMIQVSIVTDWQSISKRLKKFLKQYKRYSLIVLKRLLCTNRIQIESTGDLSVLWGTFSQITQRWYICI